MRRTIGAYAPMWGLLSVSRQSTGLRIGMPKLPSKDKITFRWLLDHIPISWWVAIVAAAASAFSAGIFVGRISLQNLDGDIRGKIAVRDKLQSDIQALSSQKSSLQAEIVRLQVDKKVEQMTPDQVREELKKWTRD